MGPVFPPDFDTNFGRRRGRSPAPESHRNRLQTCRRSSGRHCNKTIEPIGSRAGGRTLVRAPRSKPGGEHQPAASPAQSSHPSVEYSRPGWAHLGRGRQSLELDRLEELRSCPGFTHYGTGSVPSLAAPRGCHTASRGSTARRRDGQRPSIARLFGKSGDSGRMGRPTNRQELCFAANG